VASDAGRLAGAELSCQKKLANKNATAADDAAAPTPTPAAAAAAAALVALVVVATVELGVVVTTATSAAAATNLYGGLAPMAIDASTSVPPVAVCLMEAVSTTSTAPLAARLLVHVIVVAVAAVIAAVLISQVKIAEAAVHSSFVVAATSVVQVVSPSAAQIVVEGVMTILLVRAPSDAYVARNLTLSGVSPVTYVDGIHVASVMAPPFAVPTTANATRTRKDFIVLNARTMEMERG